ncbi:histidine phosphatase family protein [Paludibaculum fermentans]|uniref:Histidine phosphatase family protein n=1 Tax=Paludibaculum fermentans TaxID=1473598 RepID=A0A7S7NY82_PALFE|nr:histidine phosphatase family protein [Paludibaculum fermentans]QOY91394.1 histidine phosphatase family protein [Paludibaculum fermentans]
MSTIYLFRHGQAGLRDDYDRLSELGHEQARRLGAWVSGEGLKFDKVIIGGLRRQRETAEAVLAALNEAGLQPTEIQHNLNWNEFDLDVVYEGIAPQIAAADQEFRAEFEEQQRMVQAGDGAIHRRWTRADTAVMRAWIEGAYPCSGESWNGFVDRIRAAGEELRHLPPDARVAVFTSATPISICGAAAFDSRNPTHIMKLAASAVNSSITVMHWRQDELFLALFNAAPHLTEPRLRTFR